VPPGQAAPAQSIPSAEVRRAFPLCALRGMMRNVGGWTQVPTFRISGDDEPPLFSVVQRAREKRSKKFLDSAASLP
jgi:hypothetical protein